MHNVIDLFTKLSDEKLIQISQRFEQIIASQIYLMLQRGVPAGKLISIVKEMDKNIKMEAAAEQVLKQASGQ